MAGLRSGPWVAVHCQASPVPINLLDRCRAAVQGIGLAAALIDLPPNLLTVDAYVELMTRIATDLGASCQVIRGIGPSE